MGWSRLHWSERSSRRRNAGWSGSWLLLLRRQLLFLIFFLRKPRFAALPERQDLVIAIMIMFVVLGWVVALGRLCRQHGLASSVGWLGANMVVVVGLGGGVRLRVFAVFVQQAERWWVGPDVSGAQVLLALLDELLEPPLVVLLARLLLLCIDAVLLVSVRSTLTCITCPPGWAERFDGTGDAWGPNT